MEKRTFFAKTLSFRLSFCYRFGLRFSYVFLYVEASMHHTLWALSFFFSSLSFYHGLDMFLATRDALVINGSYPGFFTSSLGVYGCFQK